MVKPTPTEQVKHQIKQTISQAFRQLRGRIQDDTWREFESFFWKVRPLVELDYSKFGDSFTAETTGPNSSKRPNDDFVPSPVPDNTFKPGVL